MPHGMFKRMKKNRVFFVICVILIMMAFTISAYASEDNKIEGFIVDNTTGVVTHLDVKRISTQTRDINGICSDLYEVFAPLAEGDSTEAGKTEAGVTARLKVNYILSGENIKLIRFSGEWVPSSNIYIVGQRECFVTDDVNKKRFYPTKNTFNESLNWNYVYKKPVSDISGARAYTQAIITIAGMEGTHTLFLFSNVG